MHTIYATAYVYVCACVRACVCVCERVAGQLYEAAAGRLEGTLRGHTLHCGGVVVRPLFILMKRGTRSKD